MSRVGPDEQSFELTRYQNEIDDITRRRTAFETALVKQKVEKDDFYRYAEYEINLEQLRKVRWKRLGRSD